ncbi:MAG: hypothetical protein WBS20_17340, partial [Lysobacterales bacterium]
ALTLRQAGRVSQLQGKPEEALPAFVQSRDLLSSLSKKNTESTDILYELGNAEFYIGNFYLSQGDFARARPAFEKNHEITGQLLQIDPDNPEWMMERSYSHNNLAAVQLQSGTGVDEASLAHMQQAIDLIERVMLMVPDKTVYSSHYATTLAWAADAQSQACNLENAMVLRQKALQLAETLSISDPGDNDLKRRYAYAISGVSSIQTKTGQTGLAEQNLELVISILEQLSAADPSNILYPQEIAYRQFRLARLMAANGRLEEAAALMSALESKIGMESGLAEQNEEMRHASIDFHLAFAKINYQSGDKDGANLQLQKALQLQKDSSGPGVQGHSGQARLEEMRFQWWEINGEEGLAAFPVKPAPGSLNTGGLISCEDALSTAKEFVIKGEPDRAVVSVRYLQERGYADPAFIRFCTKYGLCPGESVTL